MVRQTPGALLDPLGYLQRSVTDHGTLVAFPAGPGALHVADAAGAAEVLITRHGDFSKRTPQYQALGRVTGPGLLVADPPAWREHRRVLQPAFHHGVVTDAVSHSRIAADGIVRDWLTMSPAHRRALDVEPDMRRIAARVVERSLFGSGPRHLVRRMVQAAVTASDYVVDRGRYTQAVLSWLPTPVRYRSSRLLDALGTAVAELVDARLASDLGDDALGLLLHAHQAGQLDRSALRDEAVTLVVAGQETVATALTWALTLLARHSDWQERVRQEVQHTTGGEPVDAGALVQLVVTKAVVDETLRLFPPAWLVSRRVERATSVQDVDLPVGALVIISPYVIHRRSEYWPNPHQFDPGRWLGADRPVQGTYLPFGVGPRMCVGRDLAVTEATVVLASILRDVVLSRPAHSKPQRLHAGVTLRPKGGSTLRAVPSSAGSF